MGPQPHIHEHGFGGVGVQPVLHGLGVGVGVQPFLQGFG